MELNGEEKAIRALFRELRLEDERTAPTFACEGKRRPSRSGVSLSFRRVVLAGAVVCLILVSTLLLRRPFFGTQPPRHEFTEQLEMGKGPDERLVSRGGEVSTVIKETRTQGNRGNGGNRAEQRRRLDRASRSTRLASSLRRRRGEAFFVSDWQSPTGAFLRSPGDELLKSVPQLNQSSSALASFLNSSLN